MVEAQTRLESLILKPKKSVCLLVSAYKLVYLQSSCVAGFLIRSITGCKERTPKRARPINLWDLLLFWTQVLYIISLDSHWTSPSNLPRPGVIYGSPETQRDAAQNWPNTQLLGQVLFTHIWSLILYCHASLSFMTVLLDRQKHVNPCLPQTAQSRYKVVEPVSDYRISLQLYETSLF